MPISTPASFTKGTKLAIALVMLLAGTAHAQSNQLQLGYLASFDNGSLDPSLDLLGIGPMKEGDTQVANSNPSWTPLDGELILQITRPATAVGPVSAEIVTTPVSFGPGTAFEEHATFIRPIGPHEAGDVWAVAMVARTGNINDLAADTRVVATLQVAATHLRLNAVGAKGGSTFVNLPDDNYRAIFDPANPQPFTLELLIDRITGGGRITLFVGNGTFARDVRFQAFQANSGSVISAVGPGIAIAQGPGQTASVHLTEFQLLLPNQSTNSTATCPKSWGASCRAVPSTH